MLLTLRVRKAEHFSAPGPPHWIAWEHDERIVNHYADGVQAALSRVSGLRDAIAQASDGWRSLPIGKHNAPDPESGGVGGATPGVLGTGPLAHTGVASPEGSRIVAKADTSANQGERAMAHQVSAQAVESNVTFNQASLNAILANIYGDAYLIGTHAAANVLGPDGGSVAFLSGLDQSIDWDTWEPGNPQAALKAAQGGLAALLDARGIVIKGIQGTTLDQLGDVIAEGLEKGESTQAIYLNIRPIVDNPVRATLIARTETARAVTAASFETYEQNGVAEWVWMVAPGACPACLQNSLGGPYPIGGGPALPQHPACRCCAQGLPAA